SAPVVAARVGECAAALAPHVDWSLTDVLRGVDGGPGLDRVDVVQPVLWAVMVSLAALWRAAGVEPDAVVGHSQGEIAAACVAGALSVEDAAAVAALRSRALLAVSGKGGMVSVPLPAADVEARLADFAGRISVAALNGAASTVVSGDVDALTELLAGYEAEGVHARRIDVDYASHSAHVDAIRAELLAVLAHVAPRPSEVPFYSTGTGEPLDTATLDAEYWFRNLREPVRFAPVVRRLLDDGLGVFVEASPHPVVTVGIGETVEQAGARAVAVGSLRRDEDGPERFVAALAEAWTHGVAVDWARVFPAGDLVDRPTYAFQRQRSWPDGVVGASGDPASLGLGAADHPLLAAAVAVADTGAHLLTGRISVRTHPWLADHAVAGNVLLPGTAFVELALRAGQEVGAGRVEELTIEAPLVLPAGEAVGVQVGLGAPDEFGRRAVSVHSRPGEAGPDTPWTRHATGTLVPDTTGAGFDLTVWPPAGAEPVDLDGYYEGLSAAGYGYGPTFQGLRAAWRRGDEVFAEVGLPVDQHREAERFAVHPALLDAALHGVGLATFVRDTGQVRLPFAWTGGRVDAVGATGARVRIAPATGPVDESAVALAVQVADPTGRPVASV
ncbi:MAG TPA: acyltransferase domain-containing protein, partial [Micromonospora sp.]